VFYDVHDVLTLSAFFHIFKSAGDNRTESATCTSEVTAQMVKAADSEHILHHIPRCPRITRVASGL
jgi:hypothetical protein